MIEITVKSRYIPSQKAELVAGQYGTGQKALRLIAADGQYAGEPIATATVNLDAYGIHPADNALLIKCGQEAEGILESLIENGIVRPATAHYSYGIEGKASEAPLTELGLTLYP